LLGFRTLKEIGSAGRQRYQGFQRGPEGVVACLMLLDPRGNLDLPVLQRARFFIVFVLRNSPSMLLF